MKIVMRMMSMMRNLIPEFHEDDDEIHDDDSIPKGFIEMLMKLMILVMIVIRKNLIP